MDRKTLVAVGVVLSLFIVIIVFAGGVLAGRAFEKSQQPGFVGDMPNDMEKPQQVLSIIKNEYVDPVSQKKIVEGAVKGMVDALGDPFTHYLDAKYFESFQEETNGYFDGVGILVSQNKDKELVVVAPIENSPAEKAGVKTNDVIVKIDNKPTKGMTEDQAIDKIRGKRGTQVVLAMKREGIKKLLEFKLTREKITFPNVSSKMLKDKIGYIKIHQFNAETSSELSKKLDKLKEDGMKGLVLDLRGNPGGVLEEAVNVGSLWIKEGPIVKIKSRTGRLTSQDAIGGADTKIPLVVLVNKGSASASEIVSGALQDYGRAVLVGETTFGKACVQTVITLEDGSGLLLTTDKYYTPKGRMIHKKGIKPDVVVKLNPKSKKDDQLLKGLDIMKDLISGKRKLKTAS